MLVRARPRPWGTQPQESHRLRSPGNLDLPRLGMLMQPRSQGMDGWGVVRAAVVCLSKQQATTLSLAQGKRTMMGRLATSKCAYLPGGKKKGEESKLFSAPMLVD
jgi:hypothetical protein